MNNPLHDLEITDWYFVPCLAVCRSPCQNTDETTTSSSAEHDRRLRRGHKDYLICESISMLTKASGNTSHAI